MGNTSGGVRIRRRGTVPLAISLLTVVAVLAAWACRIVVGDGTPGTFSPGAFVSPFGRPAVESPSAVNGSLTADVPLALLGDYFEHGLEHAPPRDPRGVMQKREGYYQPPPEPVGFLGGKLTPAAGDRRFARLMNAWSDRSVHGQIDLQGQVSTTSQIEALELAAAESSVDALSLLRAAQGFQFLDGDALACAITGAGLVKAEREFARARSGDPSALPLLHQLEQTKVLWDRKDYPALEKRFALARRLNPPLSIESRRAGYLLADALFYQHRFKEAETVVLSVMDEHRRVGDLGLLDAGDLYEMTYQVGYLEFCAGDLEPAIQNLRQIQSRGEHDKEATEALYSALLQTGRLSEAQTVRGELARRFTLVPRSLESLALEQEEAAQLQEWKRQMTSPGSLQASISERRPQ